MPKTLCVLCREREATADIEIRPKSGSIRKYPACVVCRAAVSISHTTGIPSNASIELERKEQAFVNPGGLIIPGRS